MQHARMLFILLISNVLLISLFGMDGSYKDDVPAENKVTRPSEKPRQQVWPQPEEVNGEKGCSQNSNDNQDLRVEFEKLWAQREEGLVNLIADYIHRSFQNNNQGITLSNPCIKKSHNLNPELIDHIIQTSSPALQRIIKNLKNKKENNGEIERYIPGKIILLGDPGTGKSSLALAIALYCNIPYTFIELNNIHNEYKDSGPSTINRICAEVVNYQELHIVILDELQSLVRKRNSNDFDISAAQALWSALDNFEENPNIVVIGTANEISDLPKQLLSRIADALFIIERPSKEIRECIIQYYFSIMPKHIYVDFNDNEIKQIIKKTHNLVARDLKKIIEIAYRNVDYEGPENLEKDQKLQIRMIHIDEAIQLIRKNNGFVPWYVTIFEKYISSNTERFWQLGIQLFFTYLGYLVQRKFHNEQLAINQLHHEQSLGLTREVHDASTFLNRIFHQENMEFRCAEIGGTYNSKYFMRIMPPAQGKW